MGGADTGHDATGTPDPVEKGFATLTTLRYTRIPLLCTDHATHTNIPADFVAQNRGESIR